MTVNNLFQSTLILFRVTKVRKQGESNAHYRFRVKDQFWDSHTKNQLPRWFLSAI